ncbi:hypothetical protein [Sphingorhabdus sp. 109]|uniref:hypothetical protein n=1 Tax=Sphingorhabdus sp. 109 TaxID=2653173 RepID=UPI0012F00B38|nr:hypothetical protein [Sphingorhabdus sp. 109]VWX62524.1 conserved hypothetical protein [Sphingorhabdus sp. 109]
MAEQTPPSSVTNSAIFTLDPKDIEVGSRIGFVWPEKAQALGAIMKSDGQIEPVQVRRNGTEAEKPWRLVIGAHRTFGAGYAGISLLATEITGSVDELRMKEAAENIQRRGIGPIERAMFIRAMADIYETRFFEKNEGDTAQSIGQSRRWQEAKTQVQIAADKKADLEADHSAATIAGLYGWQQETAEALDMSARSLRDYLFIHRTVVTIAGTDESQGGRAHALARHPLGAKRKSVMEIGGIGDETARKAIIDLIASDHDHEIKSVGEAKIKWGLKPNRSPAPEGQSKYMANATANLDRLSAASWKSMAPVFANKIKPSALQEVRDAIDARIAAGEAE